MQEGKPKLAKACKKLAITCSWLAKASKSMPKLAKACKTHAETNAKHHVQTGTERIQLVQPGMRLQIQWGVGLE